MPQTSLLKKHFCDECGERIFRRGFKVEGKLLCKRCLYTNYSVRFNDYEYTLEKSEEPDKSQN